MFNRTYFTLSDLYYDTFYVDLSDTDYWLSQSTSSEDNAFTEILTEWFDFVTPVAPLNSAEAKVLFEEYVLPYYAEDVICYIDGVEDDFFNEHKEEAYKSWLRKYCTILKRSYDRYKPLIDFYADAKNKLMDKIASKSVQTLDTKTEFDTNDSVTQRYNDTPQNGGDFTEDSYTSTYQKNDSVADQETNNSGTVTVESETDGSTIMARLDEINKRYENIYKQWCDEFGGLFIESAEVD